MKLQYIIAGIICVLASQKAFSQTKGRSYDNAAAIEEVIREAYINGVYNEGYLLSVTQGFIPDFKAIIFEGNGQSRLESLQDWIDKTKENINSGNLPLQGPSAIDFKIINIQISDKIANVQLQFLKGGKLQHTDFIGMYHFPEGWKLVNMMYEEL